MGLGRPTAGDRAWLVMFLGVAAYDWWAAKTDHDTMSKSFGRALDDPARRWPTLAFWLYLTSHLTRVLPDQFDPLRRWQ